MSPERAVGIKDYFELHNVVRNTTTAGADDVLTEFVGMCEILFIHGHDVGSCYETPDRHLAGASDSITVLGKELTSASSFVYVFRSRMYFR